VFRFTSWPLYPWRKPSVPTEKGGWVPEPVWAFWRKDQFLSPDCPARSLVTGVITNIHSDCKAGTIVATSYAALVRVYGLSVFQIQNPGKEMHLSSPDLWL